MGRSEHPDYWRCGFPAEKLERGERFEFDVEQVLTPEAIVREYISLTHYSGSLYHPKKTVRSAIRKMAAAFTVLTMMAR
jgi:hypothetical protein